MTLTARLRHLVETGGGHDTKGTRKILITLAELFRVIGHADDRAPEMVHR